MLFLALPWSRVSLTQTALQWKADLIVVQPRSICGLLSPGHWRHLGESERRAETAHRHDAGLGMLGIEHPVVINVHQQIHTAERYVCINHVDVLPADTQTRCGWTHGPGMEGQIAGEIVDWGEAKMLLDSSYIVGEIIDEAFEVLRTRIGVLSTTEGEFHLCYGMFLRTKRVLQYEYGLC